MPDLDAWRTITITTAAVGQTLFTLLYLMMPWWRSFLGRALFFKAVTFMVLVDMAMLSQVWEFGNRDAVFVWLYAFLALGIWAQTLAFVIVRLKGREPFVRGDRRQSPASVMTEGLD